MLQLGASVNAVGSPCSWACKVNIFRVHTVMNASCYVCHAVTVTVRGVVAYEYAMFPIPTHLPRKATTQDPSSKLLSKISLTNAKSLSSVVAASWVAELDQAIIGSKVRPTFGFCKPCTNHSQAKIHERLRADLPLFEKQFAASDALQERFAALVANVGELDKSVSHPEVAKPRSFHIATSNRFTKLGTISTIVHALSTHAALAQRAQDIETTLDAMEHFLGCRDGFDSLVSLADEGKLPEAVQVSTRLQKLLDAAPPALKEAEVFSSMNVRPSL